MLTTGRAGPFRSPQVIRAVDAPFHRGREDDGMRATATSTTTSTSTTRTVVAVTGGIVVAAYAALLALDQIVLDPLTLVPGWPLTAIAAEVAAHGNAVALDLVGVLVIAAVGVALGIAVAVAGLRGALPTHVVAVLHLGVLVLGALATFPASFLFVMDVLDSFRTTEDHSPWMHVLWLTSLLALIAIPAVLFGEMVRTLRGLRAGSSPQDATPAA
jgi:hypothetical protein